MSALGDDLGVTLAEAGITSVSAVYQPTFGWRVTLANGFGWEFSSVTWRDLGSAMSDAFRAWRRGTGAEPQP